MRKSCSVREAVKPGWLLRFLFGFSALLAVQATAGAKDVTVSLVDQGHDVYNIQGSFHVPVTSHTAWDAISDYDHIADFVPSMRSSKILRREGDSVFIEQKSTVGFLFFRQEIRVLLNIHEDPCRSIQFEDISKANFKFYRGSWTIEPMPQGVLVSYRLMVHDGFSGPGFVVRRTSQKMIASLLEQVRAEIIRRSHLPDSKVLAKVCR